VIAYVAAAILLLLAFLPKLAAAFLALPLEVAGAVLVFTASFMITSGMQIILSRTPDTRAIYVIGISTLLALSKKVFPDYFTALSPLEQSLASSPLALGLMAAVALTLLFRFGTTQTAVLTLAPGEDADGRVGDFIRHQAAQWKVDAEAAENCRASIVGVLAYLKAHALHDSDITLRARFDGIDLVLAIDYRGRMIPAAGVQVVTREPSARTEDLQDEEAPAYVGLRNFLRNIHADQKHVASQGPDVRIRLRFAV
jgi:NCS2 family nucleobase:cation symporter-2